MKKNLRTTTLILVAILAFGAIACNLSSVAQTATQPPPTAVAMPTPDGTTQFAAGMNQVAEQAWAEKQPAPKASDIVQISRNVTVTIGSTVIINVSENAIAVNRAYLAVIPKVMGGCPNTFLILRQDATLQGAWKQTLTPDEKINIAIFTGCGVVSGMSREGAEALAFRATSMIVRRPYDQYKEILQARKNPNIIEEGRYKWGILSLNAFGLNGFPIQVNK